MGKNVGGRNGGNDEGEIDYGEEELFSSGLFFGKGWIDMSKKDEVIKYSQELKKVLHDWNGENCGSKSEKIAEKAQSLGVPWKTVQCTVDAKIFGLDQYSMSCPHEYAIVDGTKVDVAGDPTFRKAMRGSEVKEANKMVMDEYFSKKHTWRDVMQLLSKKMSEMGAQQVDVKIDKKYIIFFDAD